MFAAATKPTAFYNQVDVETGVNSANPYKLVLMMFDGALLAINSASAAMREGRIADKGQSISKAIDIISNGLNASLDHQAGGELAGRLSALYDYFCTRLLHANLRNDQAALTEVATLIREIKGAWEEIADDPAVVSRTGTAR